MSIHFITYGDDNFKKSRERICKEAENTKWFSTIKYYTNNDYSLDFYNKNKDILDNKVGGGFWIWKPYFIKKHLDLINDNDYLVYLDSGCTINKDGYKRFKEYLDIVKNHNTGIIAFQYTNNYFTEKVWNTNEIFNYFNVKDNKKITDSFQILGGVQIIQKKQKSVEIINKWYSVITDNINLFTNYYNENQDKSYFKDNRHDQSVQSVIKKLYNCPVISANEIEFKHNQLPFHASRIHK
jgi:hypothetical protein